MSRFDSLKGKDDKNKNKSKFKNTQNKNSKFNSLKDDEANTSNIKIKKTKTTSYKNKKNSRFDSLNDDEGSDSSIKFKIKKTDTNSYKNKKNSRFDSLKSDDEASNSSGTNFRNRKSKDGNKARSIANMTGTMPLPGIEPTIERSKGNKYVAPGSRNKPVNRMLPKEKPAFKSAVSAIAKNFNEKEGDFPDIAGNIVKIISKTNDTEEENKPTTKWKNIVEETESSPPPPPPPREPVKPGWIRLSYNKQTKRIEHEHGDPTKEHLEFMAREEYRKKRAAELALARKEKEYKEWNDWMYPNDNYIYSWEWDDHVHHEEWLKKIAEDDGYDIEYSDNDEYYSDDY